jgi:hypothetical protein
MNVALPMRKSTGDNCIRDQRRAVLASAAAVGANSFARMAGV